MEQNQKNVVVELSTTHKEPRIRLNAKQNTKGEYQLDSTVETFGDEAPDILASRHIGILNEFVEQMKLNGYKIAGGE